MKIYFGEYVIRTKYTFYIGLLILEVVIAIGIGLKLFAKFKSFVNLSMDPFNNFHLLIFNKC